MSAYRAQSTAGQIRPSRLPSVRHRFRSASHSVPYPHRWRSIHRTPLHPIPLRPDPLHPGPLHPDHLDENYIPALALIVSRFHRLRLSQYLVPEGGRQTGRSGGAEAARRRGLALPQ